MATALASTLVVTAAPVDVDAHPEILGRPVDLLAELAPVALRCDQDAEAQPAPKADLLALAALDASARHVAQDTSPEPVTVPPRQGHPHALASVARRCPRHLSHTTVMSR